MIFADRMTESAREPGVEVHHEQQRDGYGRNGTEGSAGSTPSGCHKFICAVCDQSHPIIIQDPCAPQGYGSIDDLLDDLGDRGRDHVGEALEETAECTGYGENKNGRRKHSQTVLGIFQVHDLFGQDTGKQIRDQCEKTAGYDSKAHRAQEDLVRVAHLTLLYALTHQPGHRKGQAERRDHKNDGIDLICS